MSLLFVFGPTNKLQSWPFLLLLLLPPPPPLYTTATSATTAVNDATAVTAGGCHHLVTCYCNASVVMVVVCHAVPPLDPWSAIVACASA